MLYDNENKQIGSYGMKNLDGAKYMVNVDLADVLRAYTEGMVTAFNLGLMERNIEASERGNRKK